MAVRYDEIGQGKPEYGKYYPANVRSGSKDNDGQYEYTINYDEGIISNHAIASGPMASNTPLRELIQAHKDYWLKVNGQGKDDVTVPDLEVYIVDVWSTREEILPIDQDGVKDRYYDLLLCDKTDYDEKVANIVSDYVTLTKDLIRLAKSKKISKTDIDGILSRPAKSSHRSGVGRTYNDLIQGRFDIDVKRIENYRVNKNNKISP